MPKNPEHEGSPRLMTVTEIAAEHGVSRQTIHTYRRAGVFPSPVEGEGSTRLRFRENEVAAFFKANPKQPRKKRTFPPDQPGEPVSDSKTVTIQTPMPDSRARALAALVHREGGHLEITLDELLSAPDRLIVSSTEGGSIILRDPAAHERDGRGPNPEASDG